MRITHTIHPEKLCYDVNGIAVTDSCITLSGWAVSTLGPVSVCVEANGEKIASELQRTTLLDVSRTVLGDDSQPMVGIRVSFENKGYGAVTVVLSDGTNTHRETVTVTGAIKRRKVRLRAAQDYLNAVGQIPGAWKEEGGKRFLKEFSLDLKSDDYRYEKWLSTKKPTEESLKKERETVFPYRPKISVAVPAYKTPERFLREMIENFQAQTYENFELLIADGSPDDSVKTIAESYAEKDARICYKKLEKNDGISGNTNEALKMATGDWIGLMDHDDLVSPSLLYEVVKKANEDLTISAIYTDEGKITMDGLSHFGVSLKPDYDLTYLESGNYITHFFCVKREVVERVGLFDKACDGAQDLDFILRCTEREHTAHVAKVLYHWRCHPASTADNPESKMYCYENGCHAVNKHYERLEIPAKAYVASVYGHYLTVFDALKKETGISAVIWGEGSNEAFLKTKTSLESLGEGYAIEFLDDLSEAKDAKYENLLFIRKGSEILPADLTLFEKRFLKEDETIRTFPNNPVGRLEAEKVGAVGLKVVDKDGLFVYGGMIRNKKHAMDSFPRRIPGNSTILGGKCLDQKAVSGISLDGCMMKKSVLEQVGGLSETFGNAMEIDLSLKLSENGYQMIYEPLVTVKTEFAEPKNPPYLREKSAFTAVAKAHEAFLKTKDPSLNENTLIHLGRPLLKA